MLLIIRALKYLNFSKLMDVYEEENIENALKLYPHQSEYEGVYRVEQDFFQYLRNTFFAKPDSFYAVWSRNEKYVSAVRVQKYRDGFLLDALETKTDQRHNGYAQALVQEVLRNMKGTVVYSHIHIQNKASLKLHQKCGFQKVLDYAVFLDGSVYRNCITVRKVLK